MPKAPKEDHPDTLKPYVAHGLDPVYTGSDKEALAECLFCGGKFSINIQQGTARCFGCNTGSEKNGSSVRGFNAYTFIRQLHEASFDRTTSDDYRELANDRRLMSVESLIDWGVCKSISTGHWLIPAYNEDEKMINLYRYIYSYKAGKRILYPTPTMSAGLFMPTPFNASKSTVDLCEGPWDGIALYECFRACKEHEGRLVPTSSNDFNLAADRNVAAVPGNIVFQEKWHTFFAGKIVNLYGDSDYPKENKQTGRFNVPAGYLGMQRTAEILSRAPNPPLQIKYLDWGPEGYDKTLPDSTDVRDYINR